MTRSALITQVRARFCALLAPLKACLKLPTDSSWMEVVGRSLAALRGDPDASVREAAELAHLQCQKVPERS